jgi:LysM repeat protein
MSSIRPLFTITVLVVVGAFLYVKINEGPARTAGSNSANSQGIPPLAAAGGGATLAQDTSAAAPAWPPADAKAPAEESAATMSPALQAAPTALAPADAAKTGMPEVPAIPEMPEFPKTADASAASQPSAAAPKIELPKNVPAAQYGADAENAAGAPGGLPALPTLPAETASIPGAPTAPAATPSSAAIGMPAPPTGAPSANAVTPLTDDRYGSGAAAPATTPPVTALPIQSDDRYGTGASSYNAPATTAPAATGDSFAASWPAIQAALDHRDLKTAHQMLSKWHGNDSLSPADAQKVEALLGQLAGTVIYSNEHQLEPARVVKPGETLETIAKEYNVPWQLIAKINGIPSASQVQPGQSLKVVRGPFNAVVDLHRSELTLEVDGRYAGTFPISIPPGTQVSEGPWLVDQKDAIASSRSIVLRSAANSAASLAAPKLTITASATAPGAGMPGLEIQVAPQDADDLSDILSVGSRVIVRR